MNNYWKQISLLQCSHGIFGIASFDHLTYIFASRQWSFHAVVDNLLGRYIFLEIQILGFDVPECRSSYQQLLLQSAFWKWRQKHMWYTEYFMEVRNDFHLKPN